MRWFRPRAGGRTTPRSDPGRAGKGDDDEAILDAVPFVCSTCGRTDLPPAGDWDPPICAECDAAINFDAIEEVELFDDH